MSTWTDTTAAIRTKISSVLDDGGSAALPIPYIEIPDGADIDKHADLFLNKGWALNIQESERRAQSVKQVSVEDRTYTVTLTRQIDIVSTYTEGFVSLKSEMMEHSELLRKAFESDNNLGGEVVDVDWQGDTGIDEITDPNPETPGPRFYIMGIEFTVTINFN